MSDNEARHSDSAQSGAGGWDPAACQGWREEAAVALLSRRPVPPQAQHHLDVCPPCRDEIDELVALTPALATTREVGPPTSSRPSDLLLVRLLGETARLRRRRRLLTGLAAAAVLAVALPVGVQLGRALVPAAAPPSASRPTAPVVARGEGEDQVSGTRVEVELRAAGAGSRIDVELYRIPGGAKCHVTVIDRAARRVDTPSWTVPAQGYAAGQTFPEVVDVGPTEVVAVDLVDDSTNRVMAHIPLLPV